MKNLKLVEPFKYTFSILNRLTMDNHGPFESLAEALEFSYEKYGWDSKFGEDVSRIPFYTLFDDKLHFWKEKDRKAPRLVALRIEEYSPVLAEEIDDTRREIRASRKYNYHYNHYSNKYNRANDLFVKKGDGRKIKKPYGARLRHYPPNSWWNNQTEGTEAVAGGMLRYYRHPRTKAELSFNEMIENEYRNEYPNLVRHRRTTLCSSWDDLPIGAWDVYNSWKHHSKRRKQWIPR